MPRGSGCLRYLRLDLHIIEGRTPVPYRPIVLGHEPAGVALDRTPIEDPSEPALRAIFAVGCAGVVILAVDVAWVVLHARLQQLSLAWIVGDLAEAPPPGFLESGLALKERVFDVAILIDALRRIVDGETVIDPTIVARLVGRRRRQDPLAELTQREREVLALVAEGLSNRAIASRLFITDRTVEAHIKQIFMKLRLPESSAQHRRVLAVLAFLRA